MGHIYIVCDKSLARALGNPRSQKSRLRWMRSCWNHRGISIAPECGDKCRKDTRTSPERSIAQSMCDSVVTRPTCWMRPMIAGQESPVLVLLPTRYTAPLSLASLAVINIGDSQMRPRFMARLVSRRIVVTKRAAGRPVLERPRRVVMSHRGVDTAPS